jgi:hypothetical protein
VLRAITQLGESFMKLRSTFRSSVIAGLFTLGVTACGDDDNPSGPITTPDAGDVSTLPVTSESSTSATGGALTSDDQSSTAEVSSSLVTGETSDGGLISTLPVATTEPVDTTTDLETSSSTTDGSPIETLPPVETCEVPRFSVFSRSDTEESWDDNDFSSVTVDSSQCPVLVDVTWPHEEGWENADPAEANHEQVHFTLDGYGPSNLVGKEISATVELVSDERGPSANAGGYLVSIVSVSTYDNVIVTQPELEADAGPDAALPEPETFTQTGYSEAETPERDRILLRRAGDRATVSLRLPAKTAEVDSYDPERVLKVNLRFYNVYEGPSPVSEELDGGVDASVTLPLDGDPSLVYDYLTTRFAISKYVITDVAGSAQ